MLDLLGGIRTGPIALSAAEIRRFLAIDGTEHARKVRISADGDAREVNDIDAAACAGRNGWKVILDALTAAPR